MSPNKRKTLLNSLLSSHLACSCGPSRPNHHDVFQPRPRPKPKSSSSSSNDGEIQITLSSSASTEDKFDENKLSPAILSPNSTNGKIDSGPGPGPSDDVLSLQGSVVVVVKDSEDPYKDFRDSMLQIIDENKIFSKEDLHHLLRCFLRLNSPTHHHYILHAFFQVCDAVVSSSNTSNKH